MTTKLSEVGVNRVWVNAVANIIERDGHFPLESHDVVRLREIAKQLKDAETAFSDGHLAGCYAAGEQSMRAMDALMTAMESRDVVVRIAE